MIFQKLTDIKNQENNVKKRVKSKTE